MKTIICTSIIVMQAFLIGGFSGYWLRTRTRHPVAFCNELRKQFEESPKYSDRELNEMHYTFIRECTIPAVFP